MIVPVPTHNEPEQGETKTPAHEWVEWFLCVPSWKCTKCGLTNFGHNKLCADCRIEKEKL